MENEENKKEELKKTPRDKMKAWEELDKKYSKVRNEKEKVAIENIQKKIKEWDKEISAIKKDIVDLYEHKKDAHDRKDSALEKQIEETIKKRNKEVEAKKGQLVKLNNLLSRKKQDIEKYLDEISQDPEIRQVTDRAIAKKLTRKNEEKLKETEYLKELKNLVDQHPVFKNNIIGMKTSQVEMLKLQDELRSINIKENPTQEDEKRKIQLIEEEAPKLQEKYRKNKDNIINYIRKNNIDISEEFLDDFIEGNFKVSTKSEARRDKDGKIVYDKTKEWNIEGTINKKIKQNEKNIKNNDKVLSKIEGKNITSTLNKEDENGRPISIENASMNLGINVDNNRNNANLPDVQRKPKWWQFKTRFVNWLNSRDGHAENENNEADVKNTYSRKEYEKEKDDNQVKDFKAAYKYNVVKDYAERREQELFKSIKEDSKAEKEQEEEQEER